MIDLQQEFSDAQTVTSTAASTNVIDKSIGTDHAGSSADIEGSYSGGSRLRITIATAYSGGTSVTFALQDSANNSDWSATEITTGAIVVATLTAGYVVMDVPLPVGLARYLRLYYTVSGSPSQGAIDAYIYS